MKKRILVALILSLIASILGCVPSGYVSEDLESYKQAMEILRCLDEEDVDGLKSLFCERVASTHDLDVEIAEAMEFYQGKHESFSNIGEGGGSSIRDGEYVDYYLGYWITDINDYAGGKAHADRRQSCIDSAQMVHGGRNPGSRLPYRWIATRRNRGVATQVSTLCPPPDASVMHVKRHLLWCFGSSRS